VRSRVCLRITNPSRTANTAPAGMRKDVATSPHRPCMPARRDVSIGDPSAWRVYTGSNGAQAAGSSRGWRTFEINRFDSGSAAAVTR